jgi:hypothetical protein
MLGLPGDERAAALGQVEDGSPVLIPVRSATGSLDGFDRRALRGVKAIQIRSRVLIPTPSGTLYARRRKRPKIGDEPVALLLAHAEIAVVADPAEDREPTTVITARRAASSP